VPKQQTYQEEVGNVFEVASNFNHWVGKSSFSTNIHDDFVVGPGVKFTCTKVILATITISKFTYSGYFTFELEDKTTFEMSIEDFYVSLKERKSILCIQNKEKKVKNNDGRSSCFWCGAPTRNWYGPRQAHAVCTKCGQ